MAPSAADRVGGSRARVGPERGGVGRTFRKSVTDFSCSLGSFSGCRVPSGPVEELTGFAALTALPGTSFLVRRTRNGIYITCEF